MSIFRSAVTFYTPPENQGQIVTVSYGSDLDREQYIERTHGMVTYRVCPWEAVELGEYDWDPASSKVPIDEECWRTPPTKAVRYFYSIQTPDDLSSEGWQSADQFAWPHNAEFDDELACRIEALAEAYFDRGFDLDFDAEFWGLSEEEGFLAHPDGRWALMGRTIAGTPYAVEVFAPPLHMKYEGRSD